MGKTSQKRNTRGFTMTEVIAVVAILAILAAIAIPAVGVIRRQLHITKLDSYARQIFLAAQNELVTMRANGELAEFRLKVESDCTKLSGAPPDFPDDAGEEEPNLYAVSGGSAAGAMLRRAFDSAEGATEKGGGFLMELDPVVGSVYSVFYVESSDLTYDSILALTDRSRSTRSKLETPLGYYSGGIPTAPGAIGELRPEVKIVNGEELYVEVTCDGIPNGSNASLMIKIKGETSEEIWTVPEMTLNVVNQPAVLILDSLEPDHAFQGNHGNLIPGENLIITASVTYSNGNQTASGVSAPQRVNSLFGSRDDAGNLTVSRLRHLNNLRFYNAALIENGITITQTEPISFDLNDWSKENNYVSNWTRNPLDYFAPVENADLLSGATYEGNRNPISDFVIRGDQGTGLFGTAKSCAFRGVLLEDCAVTGGQSVGALLGRAEDCSITDCGAYLTYRENREAEGEPTTMERWVSEHTVAGASNVGGLVGSMTGGTVENSFAALNVTAKGSNAGGLVGYASGRINNCYASGDVTASDYADGLVGNAQKLTVTGGYSTSDVIATGSAGGIAGGGSGSVSSTIAYGLVAQEGVASAHPIGTGVTVQGCKYLKQSGYNNFSESNDPTEAEPCTYAELRNSGTPNGLTTSEPYAEALRGQAFPFPLLKVKDANDKGIPMMLHYGDWPEEIISDGHATLVYYEKYSNGHYGVYGIDFAEDGAVNELNTLKGNEFTIAETGYGFLKGEDAIMPEWKLDGSGDPFTGPLTQESAIASVSGRGLYPLSDELSIKLQQQLPSAYTNIIAFEDQEKNAHTLHVNTKYAAAIFTEISHEFQFRTAEQLQNTSGHSSDWSFRQTHNIDLDDPNETPAVNKDPGMLDNSKGASYDGETNTISGLKQPLFNMNGGALMNLKLIHTNISREGGAAALALDSTGGSIRNCLAHGSVTATSGNAAGLVLNAGRTITCSYANCTVTAENGNAAGLVWKAQAIENCYTDGYVYADRGTAAGFFGQGDGTLTNCYTVAHVSGKTMYGLAPANVSGGTVATNSYWAHGKNLNGAVTDNKVGAPRTLGEIRMIANTLGTNWVIAADNTTTHPDSEELQGKAYPYPMLALDHWGDWPEIQIIKNGKVGVAAVYASQAGPAKGAASFGSYVEFYEDAEQPANPTEFGDPKGGGSYKQNFSGIYLLTQEQGEETWVMFDADGKILPIKRTESFTTNASDTAGQSFDAWKIEIVNPWVGMTGYLCSADGYYRYSFTIDKTEPTNGFEFWNISLKNMA